MTRQSRCEYSDDFVNHQHLHFAWCTHTHHTHTITCALMLLKQEAGKLLWFRWLDVSFKKQLALYDKVEEIGTVMIRLHKNSKLQMARRKRGKTTQLAHSATLDSNMAGSSSRQELEVDREKFLQGRVHDKVLVALLYSAILFSGQLVTIEDLVKLVHHDCLLV